MRFSRRTTWPSRPNRLSELLERRRREGASITDLTASNPTDVDLPSPADEVLRSLADPAALRYSPDPNGLLSAREAVCAHYRTNGVSLSPNDVILTASTSEAYAHLFTLLCEPGDEVLIPAPSYPLFEYLAQLSGVVTRSYALRYDGGWHLDMASVTAALTPRTRAIVLIHPHNPTGMFLRHSELNALRGMARERSLALIVDEVFADYAFAPDPSRVPTCAVIDDVLTFTLSGLSKLAGLPQMKLGWIVLSGPTELRAEAHERLETVCDTYLSVNTPVQVALPRLLGLDTGAAIRARIMENDAALRDILKGSVCTALSCEGGWYGIVRMPELLSDEEWALALLDERNVSVFPGYFFDLTGCHLVVSLLPSPSVFASGVRALVEAAVRVTSSRSPR